MNARASTSNPPPKFTKPSFTPSNSSRSQSFASSPIPIFRDGAPPAKRRRLASTPTSSSLSLSTPRSSSSRPEQPTVSDLHDARMASSMRVLNIWSSLAERYNRRLDDDDIVDIWTGEVIKDRGVLSALPKRCNFGDLADKDDDPATNTDPGSEAADNLAEDEGDDDDEDEGNPQETDAFPPSKGLVAPQIARLAPLRPATSSSDADDLGEFLKAEAIRRELDGGDDSSDDEFSILPPRSTPAKRVMTPARKTSFAARAKSRPLKTPVPDTGSEDEFAVLGSDRNGVYRGYRARRTPSPQVPASIPSPPPPSSSPGPPTSFSLPPSPLLSHTPLGSNKVPQVEGRFGSPTPKRQPPASTFRRTLEESLNEIDLEFPPPQPRAPSVFGRRPSSAFIIDLSLSDDETEDEKPRPTVDATTNPKPPTPARTVKENGSVSISNRPIPFVLIETKRPAPATATSTVVGSQSISAPTVPDLVTSPKKGRPRAKSLKDKPPDFGSPRNSKRGEGAKLAKERFQEGGEDVLPSGSPATKVDETPITGEATKKVKSPLLSPARSDSSPKAKTRPKSKPKEKRTPTRLPSSDDEHNLDSQPSPKKRVASPKSSPGPQKQVTTTPESGLKPRSTRKSAKKPKSTRSTRSTESPATMTTTTVKSRTPRKPPEAFVDIEGDGHSTPLSPPSPSPAPPIRPRIRGILKRKRTISSGSGSGEEQGGPNGDPGQQTFPHNGGRVEAGMIRTPEVIDVDGDDHGDDLEAGGPKPQTPLRSLSRTMTEVTSAPAPAGTSSVVVSSGDERREENTQNNLGGAYTHFPTPPPMPMRFPTQTHQSFTPYSGNPPFQAHAVGFNHVPYLNPDQYIHGPYPLFQDPNTQALLAQAVTQLAVIMNGSRPPPQMGHMGGVTGNMPTVNGFPGSPGWGMFPTWPPSTPTTSRYPHGHDHQQRSFQSPYVTHDRMGGGVGLSMPPPALFPPSNVFPPPEPIPTVQQSGAVQERTTSRGRGRSKSKGRVTFVLDPRSGCGSAGGVSDPAEISKRRTGGSPPMTRARNQTRGVERRAPGPRSNGKGKSKAGEADQDSELDAVDESGNEGSVDRHLSPKGRSEVRGRTRGPGRR